jgi:hypothetical protein
MTHIRIALALAGAAALLLPSVGSAGPTVKKRAWQTIGFPLDAARIGAWGSGYGRREVALPACPAGEAFVVTALRVAPERARLHEINSGAEYRLARVGAWQIGLTTYGPNDDSLKVPVNGSGASDAEVEFAGGLTGAPTPEGAKVIWLDATFRSAANDPPDLPPIEGMRFWVTLTGACGTATMTALP